jgi:hypothetical protein
MHERSPQYQVLNSRARQGGVCRTSARVTPARATPPNEFKAP